MINSNNKIVLAITGASGSIYAQKLLEKLNTLKEPPVEIAVIISDTAKEIWEYETGQKFLPVPPAKVFENNNFYAPFASGIFNLRHHDNMPRIDGNHGTYRQRGFG